MTGKFNTFALGGASAIVAALSMLVLGICGNIGIYTGAVEMMTKWHMFFNLTFMGIVAGMLEAAVITFVCVALVSGLYNKFVSR